MAPTCLVQAAEDRRNRPMRGLHFPENNGAGIGRQMDRFPDSDSSGLPLDKATLRRLMHERRAEAFAQNPRAAADICGRFFGAITLPQGRIVASYAARDHEIDPVLLAESLRARGHKIALPVMTGKDRALAFRLHETPTPLIANLFGIREPPLDAPVAEPDIVLVPLLAFDRRGNRLGTGGGYYDRTLRALREDKKVTAVGLAFACQEVAVIPVESHDIALDRIVTELQVF